MSRAWDDFDAEERDPSGSDEVTRETRDAHEWALIRFAEQFGPVGWAYAHGGSRLRIRAWGYVIEVRGQRSATAHGKQGASPAQLTELRELAWPAFLVFRDGDSVESVWLGDPEREPTENIDNDTAHRRVGWWVRDMDRSTVGEFRFPAEAPVFESRALF